jgi:CubicO group peptidase (beta-lactamase class C family)
MAVLILAERRALKLGESLSNYIQDLPEWGRAITLRHLLTHRSGVWDYEELLSSETVAAVRDAEVVELLRGKADLYFPPGTAFRYSNTGYAFLAIVVEAVSGISFAQFLRDNIFQPLQMHGTVAFENGVSTVANRALGYTITDTGAVESDQSLTSSVLGDGGIYSSVTDLFQWDQAFYTEKLVSASALREAFTPWSKTSDFPGSSYGFGWYLCQRRRGECQWHYGATCGFSTWIERYPAQKLTVILLANRRDADLGEIARKIIDGV